MSIKTTVQARLARTPPGVEKGVSGVEKRFQQNRQFGPGAFQPFGPGQPGHREPTRPSNRGDGTYYGPNKTLGKRPQRA